MDTDDIIICNGCGVLYSASKCYTHSEGVPPYVTNHFKCPVCKYDKD